MVNGHQGEFDSILIFAGRFSAIFTAVVAKTYQNLQQETKPVGGKSNSKSKPITYGPTAAANGWRVTREALAKQDEAMVKGYQEEIDSLLIFAGLFSAILTAFVAQTYQNLQPDSQEVTNNILAQISKQLADPTLPAEVISPASSFRAESSDLRVNALWFVGLILSLASSLGGIFVKQWLRSYMTWRDISPAQTAVTIRQYRFDSMQRWWLPQIVVFLPVLLQTALILFGIGLVDFAFQLDRRLGIMLCVIAGMCLVAILTSSLIPFFVSSAPYRSPWSAALTRIPYKLTLWWSQSWLKDPLYWKLKSLQKWHRRCHKYADDADMRGGEALGAHHLSLVLISASRTWNEIDHVQAIHSAQLLYHNDTEPSWEASSLRSLLSTALDEDALLKDTLPCIFRQAKHAPLDSSQRHLHIADCCELAGWFFGIKPSDVKVSASDNDWDVRAGALPPSTRDNIENLLRQALRQYTDYSTKGQANHRLDEYAGYTLKMLGSLMRFRRSEMQYSIHEYVCFALQLLKNRQSHTSRQLDFHIFDALCLGCDFIPEDRKCVSIFDSLSISPSDITSDIGLHQALVIVNAVVHQDGEVSWLHNSRKLVKTLGGRRVLTLAIILLAGLPEKELETGTFKGDVKYFFSNVDSAMMLASSPTTNDRDATWFKYLSPEFWQALSVLGSLGYQDGLFRYADYMLRFLCFVAQSIVHASPAVGNEKIATSNACQLFQKTDELEIIDSAPREEVWKASLEHARWLGSQNRHESWSCPRFEPWPENDPLPQPYSAGAAETAPADVRIDVLPEHEPGPEVGTSGSVNTPARSSAEPVAAAIDQDPPSNRIDDSPV